MHARTYATLINTQVGIKEMVHRIFKIIVSQTNCKNIELDLLKYYITLFVIRHLIDSGTDQKLSQTSYSFTNIFSNFENLLINWYITENKTQDLVEDTDGL